MPYLSRIAVPALEESNYLARIPALADGLSLKLRSDITFFVGRERFRQVDPAGRRRRTMRIRPAGRQPEPEHRPFISVIHRLAASGRAQFIIATHSLMLICYPGAVIYQFDADGVRKQPMKRPSITN